MVVAQGQSASKSLVPYKGNLFNATSDDDGSDDDGSDDDGSDDDDDGAELSSVAPEDEDEDEDEEQVCGGCSFFSPSLVAAATAEGTALDATKRTKRAKRRIVSNRELTAKQVDFCLTSTCRIDDALIEPLRIGGAGEPMAGGAGAGGGTGGAALGA